MGREAFKNVLFIDQYGGMGGGQAVGYRIIQAAVSEGYGVTAAFPLEADGLQDQLSRELPQVQFVNLPFFRMRWGVLAAAMRALWKVRNISGIYANGPKWFAAAALLSCMRSIPAIYHIHYLPTQLSGFARTVLKIILCLNTTKKFVFCSNDLKERFLHRLGIQSTSMLGFKCVVLENCLTQKQVAEYSAISPRMNSVEACVVVARFSPSKRQDVVVRLADEFPEIIFYFIGEADFESNEWMKALQKKAPRNAVFLGKSQAPYRLAAEKKVSLSIVPFENEGFGLVAIESMAAGFFSLLRESAGLADIARESGAAVFREDADLSSAFKHILEMKPEERARRAQAQRERVLERYHPSRFEKSAQDLLKEFS